MNVENTHQITAKIAKIGEVETVGAKGFTKRKLYLDVTTNPDYPSDAELEFQKDNVFLLDQFAPGDVVTVTFSLEGRSWTSPEGKKIFFQTARAWKIAPAGQQPAPTPAPVTEVVTPTVLNEEDDLPF